MVLGLLGAGASGSVWKRHASIMSLRDAWHTWEEPGEDMDDHQNFV